MAYGFGQNIRPTLPQPLMLIFVACPYHVTVTALVYSFFNRLCHASSFCFPANVWLKIAKVCGDLIDVSKIQTSISAHVKAGVITWF